MAYIDKEKLLKKMIHWYTKERLIDCVRDMPTADVVEVIRCKDCKYYISEPYYCFRKDILMTPHSFCSYGKRREVD